MDLESRERVLVVVPTYVEATNIIRFIDAVLGRCPGAHVLVIDDASPDGTADLVKSDRRFGASVFLVERPGKMGLGSAYIAGFRWAIARGYDLIFEMDADFSHDPAEIPNFLARAREGADLVLGSRYVGGVRVLNWPISRLFLSLGAAHYVQLLTGMPVTDPTGGFKCFRRRVLESIDLSAIQSNGYAFQIEMTFWAWRSGFTIREVPIIFADRAAGTSKMSMAITREAIWQVMRLGLLRLMGKTMGSRPR
ncbi:MAG: polyprenol monophosphomannose synthase [Verrucomicrobiae bacterium]|nr:polyprenol monophosphomannose synthase [Verrucomicrobiae bacterium]